MSIRDKIKECTLNCSSDIFITESQKREWTESMEGFLGQQKLLKVCWRVRTVQDRGSQTRCHLGHPNLCLGTWWQPNGVLSSCPLLPLCSISVCCRQHLLPGGILCPCAPWAHMTWLLEEIWCGYGTPAADCFLTSAVQNLSPACWSDLTDWNQYSAHWVGLFYVLHKQQSQS